MITFKLHNGGEWSLFARDIREIWTHPKDDAVTVLTASGQHKSVKGPIGDVRRLWSDNLPTHREG